MVRVVHEAQHRGRAGGAVQQLPQLLLRGEGEPGGADLVAEVLGVKGLVGTHSQKIELGFLPVAEEEILADGHTQNLADGGALFHVVGGLAGDPVVVDAKALQSVEGGGLLGQQLPLGPGVMVQL